MARKLYVVPDLYNFLETKQSDTRQANYQKELRADLDAYTKGEYRTVRLRHRKGSNSQLARLESPNEEVWEVQIRGTKPQIRAIGRFACKDSFVAFFWKPHDELTTEEQWRQAKIRCQTEWMNLFFPSAPVRVDDYISNGVPV
jgi:hypothetical protein